MITIIIAIWGIIFLIFTIFDLKIGIDFQEQKCLGSLFIYKEKDLNVLLNESHNIYACLDDDVWALKLTKDIFPFKKGNVLIKRLIAEGTCLRFLAEKASWQLKVTTNIKIKKQGSLLVKNEDIYQGKFDHLIKYFDFIVIPTTDTQITIESNQNIIRKNRKIKVFSAPLFTTNLIANATTFVSTSTIARSNLIFINHMMPIYSVGTSSLITKNNNEFIYKIIPSTFFNYSQNINNLNDFTDNNKSNKDYKDIKNYKNTNLRLNSVFALQNYYLLGHEIFILGQHPHSIDSRILKGIDRRELKIFKVIWYF